MVSIFLVEDDESILTLYRRVFIRKGFEIIGVARNGLEAVEGYNSLPSKPDIVVMDHRMPIKTGIEATKEILQINPHAKIFFVSADRSIRKLVISVGAVGFRLKPFKIDLLIKDIQSLVRKTVSSK